jgi:hypothetical protein
MKGEQLSPKTNAMAYLLGVYLGDGNVYSRCMNAHLSYKTFSLQVIDKDFAVKTKECIELLGYTVNFGEYVRKKRIYYQVSCNDYILCNWLQLITNDKQEIPEEFTTSKKLMIPLLVGLFDSEGWVELGIDRRYKDKKHLRSRVGFRCTSEWTHKVSRLLDLLTINHKFRKCDHKYSGFIYQITMSPKAFVDGDLYFSIERKQEKLEKAYNYITSSETIRRTSKDDDIVRTV